MLLLLTPLKINDDKEIECPDLGDSESLASVLYLTAESLKFLAAFLSVSFTS